MKKYKVIVTVLAIGVLNLAGCAGTPKPTDTVLNEIRSADYGVPISASSIDGIKAKVVQKILADIRTKMVDQNSTQIESIQAGNFSKCIFVVYESGAGAKASARSPKGYCVAFSYNSKNRMGGYAGAQNSVALVRLEGDGEVNVVAPTDGTEMSTDYYPYTGDTGVSKLKSWSLYDAANR